MDNAIQTLLQVLGHPAWSGIGVIVSLIIGIIPLLKGKKLLPRSSKKTLRALKLLLSHPLSLLNSIVISRN